MNTKIGQAVGLNTDQQAALVLSSQSDTDTFLAVLKLTCDDAFTKGRQILSELEDVYHEEEGTTAQKLQEVFPKGEEKLKEAEKYSLLLAVISGKVVYFIREGEIEAYLRRNGKLSSLSELAGSKQLISGFLTPGDRLFFATNSLVKFLGDDLEKALQLSLTEWEEETNSKIGSVTLEDQGLSGVVIDMEGDGDQVEPEITPAQTQAVETGANPIIAGNPLASFGALLSKFKKQENSSPDAWSGAEEHHPKRDLNLGKLIPKSKRARLIIGVLLIVVLVVGIGIQYKKSRDQQENQAFAQYLQTAKDDYTAAQNLSALNPTDTKNKLNSAKDNLTKALALKPGNTEVLDLRKQIEDNSDTLLQQFSSANFPEFLDLGLVKAGFKATQMSLSGTNLLLLDPSTKTLVVIDTVKKSNKVLAGQEQLGNGGFASLNSSSAFVFSGDKGVLKVDTSNNKVTTVAKKDADLSGVIDLQGFASNVYLLDKTGNKIWKYVATSDGFSDKKEYLNSGVKGDFADSKRMQIESSIYVLKGNGQILRYTRGNIDTFSLSGLDKPLNNPKSIFTSSDVDNVYILDSGNGRVVVVDKKGAYKAQYQGDKFAVASDLVVSEKNKKLYLIDGSKIYSMDLK
ncbi:MAG: hypothetical protein Q7R49_06470 [Candidatus Daviesbacteria bacterium]|nr:hypothetical protein [Candidatus Daviesbacteria bacterium]